MATPELSTEERHTAINAQLFKYGDEALIAARTSRPENTNKAYHPKQKEWAVSIIVPS